jgi:hypothetical protein
MDAHTLFRPVDFFVSMGIDEQNMPVGRGAIMPIQYDRKEWIERVSRPENRTGVYVEELWLFFHVQLLQEFAGEVQFAFQSYLIEPDGSELIVPYPFVFIGEYARAEMPYDGPELRYNFLKGTPVHLHISMLRQVYLPQLGWYRFRLCVREAIGRPILPTERWATLAQTEVLFECKS